jgi:hypothetical protein
MAETRPYKESYFVQRKKHFYVLLLILFAALAVLAFLFLRSGSGRETATGGEVHGTVSRQQEQESRDMASSGTARADAQMPSSPPPPVNVVSGEAGTAEIAVAENQNTAAGPPEAEPRAEPAPGEDEPGLGYARTREAGVDEYDREVGELAQKADEIDSLWQKHRVFCQGTIAVTVGNAYGREWFGIYTTINAADTPECKMMIQDMQTLAEEIDAGMEAAWEKAHRAGVYPGQMRAVQQKYLMELDRWNK